MKTNKNKKSPMCRLCGALGTAILVAIILVCVPFTLPKILGYQAYTVISGSMEPAISVGSLVYVRSQEPEKIQAGEVIAYLGGRDTNSVITHRVVENKIADRKFITKGDANQTTDMNAVTYKHLLGKVEYIVPTLGIIAQFLTSITGKFAAGFMVVAAILLQVTASLLDKKKAEG